MPAKSADHPFSEEFRFLKGLIASPKSVGAIAPSSPQLAKAIAAQVPEGARRVLELGPGTGVVTTALIARGIAPEAVTAVEFDRDFARMVAERCPGVRVIRGDAFNLARTLGEAEPLDAVVSGLPLLNHAPEKRRALIEGAFARARRDAPFIQFSYGLTPPVAAFDGVRVTRAARIWLNLPPAQVWVYRRG